MRTSASRFVAAALVSIQALGVVAVVTVDHRASAAEVPITDEARKHFSAGVSLLKDPDGAKYEEAYREFKAAYAASPSWKILGNLGLCAMKLERDGEAIDAYEKYLAEGQLDAGVKAQVETDLKTMKTGLVTTKLTINQPDTTIDDVRIPSSGGNKNNSYGTAGGEVVLRLHPGHHVITAKKDSYKPESWEFDAPPGMEQSHTFTLVKADTVGGGGGPGKPVVVERPIPTGVYVGLAITGVFIAGSVVTGLIAKGKKSDYDTANTGADPAAAQSLKDSGEKMNLVSTALLGGAVVSAVVTTYFFFSRPSYERPVDTARTHVLPAWTPGGGGLSFSTAF